MRIDTRSVLVYVYITAGRQHASGVRDGAVGHAGVSATRQRRRFGPGLLPQSFGEKGSSMRIRADVDTCVGSGQCALIASEVFDQDDTEGLVVLLQEQPPAEAHEAVREAEMMCPSQAIQLAP